MSNTDENINRNEERKEAPGFSTDHMDRTVDPFEDFFTYAAGNWVKNNPVPEDKSMWVSFLEIHEANQFKLRDILEDCLKEEYAEKDGVEPMLARFYESAMNTELLEQTRFKPVEKFMESISSITSVEDFMKVVTELQAYGIAPLFDIASQTDEKNSSVYGMYVYQGGLALPDRDYYLTDEYREVREKYEKHVAKVFSIYGCSPEEAEKKAKSVMFIETSIARASRSRTELRDAEKNYNRIPVKDLGAKFPALALSRFFTDLRMPELEYIIAGQPEFLDFLDSELLGNPIEDLKTYLQWNVLHEAAPYLFAEIQEENFDMFGRTIMGQMKQEPRWKRAIGTVNGYVGEALGSLYVKRHFGPEARERMSLMVNDLREVFREKLDSLPWMTDETRRRALAKFGKFRAKIGHPDRFRDYSSVEIQRDDYFGNVCRASEFEMRRQIDRAGGEVDRDEWMMTPSTVNAYFSPPDNEIVFPAGILQPPFFDTSVDPAVNYGAIGAVIAHEITHGYDDQGRRYDEDGNIKNWWTESDEENFNSRAKEVVDLYSSMEVLPGVHVNGELTLGENIADFGGVSIAYEALQRRLKKEPDLKRKIDGYTPEQRFFISYAQIWRSNILEPMARMLATVDPHSPNRFRATLPAYSHPAFKPAFSGLSRKDAPVTGKTIEIW